MKLLLATVCVLLGLLPCFAENLPSADDGFVAQCPGCVNTGSTDSDVAAACVAAHNKFRRLHVGTPDVAWDAHLADGALYYAKHLASMAPNSGPPPHSNKEDHVGISENLYYGWAGYPAVGFSCELVVKKWYDEIAGYNFATNTGHAPHFTQVVWKATTKIGMGFALGKHQFAPGKPEIPTVWVVGRYQPAGNIIGQYAENVMPLKVISGDEVKADGDDSEDNNNNLEDEDNDIEDDNNDSEDNNIDLEDDKNDLEDNNIDLEDVGYDFEDDNDGFEDYSNDFENESNDLEEEGNDFEEGNN